MSGGRVDETLVRIVSEAAGAAPMRVAATATSPPPRSWPSRSLADDSSRPSTNELLRAEAADEVGDVRQAAEIGHPTRRDVARVDAEAAEDAAEATEGFGAVASGHLRHGVGHRLDDLVEVAPDRALGIDGVEHLATEVAQRVGPGPVRRCGRSRRR